MINAKILQKYDNVRRVRKNCALQYVYNDEI